MLPIALVRDTWTTGSYPIVVDHRDADRAWPAPSIFAAARNCARELEAHDATGDTIAFAGRWGIEAVTLGVVAMRRNVAFVRVGAARLETLAERPSCTPLGDDALLITAPELAGDSTSRLDFEALRRAFALRDPGARSTIVLPGAIELEDATSKPLWRSLARGDGVHVGVDVDDIVADHFGPTTVVHGSASELRRLAASDHELTSISRVHLVAENVDAWDRAVGALVQRLGRSTSRVACHWDERRGGWIGVVDFRR